MIGYALAGAVLFLTVFLAVAVGAGAWAGRALARQGLRPRAWPVGWLLGQAGCLAALASARSGWAFVGYEAVLVAWLALGCTLAMTSERPRGATATLGTWLGLFTMGLVFLRWRGIVVDGATTNDYAFVLHDHLGQLVLPVIDRIGARPASEGTTSTVLAGTIEGLRDNLAVLLGLAAWLAAQLVVRQSAPPGRQAGVRARPGLRWDAAVFGGVGLAALTHVVAPGPAAGWLWFAVRGSLAIHVVEGLSLVRDAVRPLRTGAALTGLLAILALFLGPVAYLLAGLGAMRRLAGLEPSARAFPRAAGAGRQALLLPLAGTVLVLVALGLLSDLYVRRVTPAEARGVGLCEAVRARPEPARDEIVYEGPGLATFGLEVHERPVEPEAGEQGGLTGEEAARRCATAGKRLCTSNEWYLACTCGSASTLPADLAWWRPRRLFIDEALVQRARRDCPGTHDGPSPAGAGSCRSDHGVYDLLGGRSELLADRIGGTTHLLAGRTTALDEDWMTKCAYRAMVTEESLERHAWPFVGFRCCSSGPRATP